MGFIWSSRKNLVIGVCVAILVHAVLLSSSISRTKLKPNTEKQINVTLLEEPALDEATLDEIEPSNDIQPEIVENNPGIEPIEPITEKPQALQDILVDNQPEPRDKIQTSVSSTQFKAWLETETRTSLTKNPETVDQFDTTFLPKPRYISPPELSPDNPKSVPRGSSLFDIEKDGKVTCVAKTLNLLDISAEPGFTFKNCTGTKKFELDMAKPNNGWTQR